MERGVNICSSFDGISCLMESFKRAGIKVNKYYAFEIDEKAIKVSKKNHPEIIHLGNILNWKQHDIDWSIINFMGSGFPCQLWSLAGNQLGFNDHRIDSYAANLELFYHIKSCNPDLLFLFENVSRMKPEHKLQISKDIGVEPVFINSSLVSAQNRPRLYWTNFPYTIPEDRGCKLSDIIPGAIGTGKHGKNLGEKHPDGSIKWTSRPLNNTYEKAYCLTTGNSNSQYIKDGTVLKYTPNQCEVLQTLQEGYTSLDGIRQSDRIHMIGNAWTVEVTTGIIKQAPLKI